jgi:hypothetical protein
MRWRTGGAVPPLESIVDAKTTLSTMFRSSTFVTSVERNAMSAADRSLHFKQMKPD